MGDNGLRSIMLRKNNTTIICITGYAGSGKSTTGNMLEDYFDDVYFGRMGR